MTMPPNPTLPEWLWTAAAAAILSVSGWTHRLVTGNRLQITTMQATTEARLERIEEDLRYIRGRLDELAGRAGG